MNNSMKKQGGNVVAKKLFGLWMLLAACVGVGTVHAQTVEYIHTDALGTPVAVTDANRNVVERSEYEPYGALLNRPVSDGPGYTGHVMDAATALTYMQQRYYDPTLGRFLSVDPVTALDSGDMRHFNRYAYVYNNPYKFTDPDGRQGRRDGGGFVELGLVIVEKLGFVNRETAEGARAGVTDGKVRPSQREGAGAAKPAKVARTASGKRVGDFTPKQRNAAKAENAVANGGKMACTDCGKAVESVRNEKGVPTPANQAQVHHDPAIKDGGGQHSKAVVVCPTCHQEHHRNEKK